MALWGFAATGCGTRDCKDGTVFLTIAYDTMSSSANYVDITIFLDSVSETTISRSRHADDEVDTWVLAFARAYPRGRRIRVTVTARHGAVVVGDGEAAIGLAGSCEPLRLVVTGTASEGDMSRSDL